MTEPKSISLTATLDFQAVVLGTGRMGTGRMGSGRMGSEAGWGQTFILHLAGACAFGQRRIVIGLRRGARGRARSAGGAKSGSFITKVTKVTKPAKNKEAMAIPAKDRDRRCVAGPVASSPWSESNRLSGKALWPL